MKTLLVYDLETSGLSPCDQILQYAAIRLDAETLVEISRENVMVKWRRDMLPNLAAYQVHRLGVNRAGSVSELDAAKSIHQAVNAPLTWSGGYNTLGFDDEMLRFVFYRSLLPAYTHQYLNGCGRFDLLPCAVFYYLYAKETWHWPLKDSGEVSFKLEDLNRENQWASGRAHDAMVDVEATVGLLKAMHSKKRIWDYLLGYFDKSTDQERIHHLAKQLSPYQQVGILVSLRFGHNNQYQYPVLYLGEHAVYRNQHLFLRLDEPLEKISEAVESFIIRKKLTEPPFVLPYLEKYHHHLGQDRLRQVDENLAVLDRYPIEQWVLRAKHKEYLKVQDVDCDALLYQRAFLNQAEQSWCHQFHAAYDPGLLGEMANAGLREQALRLLWRFKPELLLPSLTEEALASIYRFVTAAKDYQGRAHITPSVAIKQFSEIEMSEDIQALRQHLDAVLAAIGIEYQ